METENAAKTKYVVTDFAPTDRHFSSGLPCSAQSFEACDFAGRTGFFGPLLEEIEGKIKTLEVGGPRLRIEARSVKNYWFTVERVA